ncbi:MAG: hypothetical protein J6I84_04770 [Bacilli bacterium]|nr:hypothetical protein [Bacilli bacterium]
MIHSSDPFNDPEFKKQILAGEGVDQLDDDNVEDEIKGMLTNAPVLPSSAKNIILDSSAIVKSEKDKKAAEFNLALNSIITRYNEEYGTDINIDFGNISNTLVAVSDPEKRKVLELYVSEVFKSIKPILLLHLLNRLVLCLDYILDPKRMLSGNELSLPDMFLAVEKLQGYILNLQEIIETSTIKDSDAILEKIASDKDDSTINSPESKKVVDEFMQLFKRDQGIE